MHKERQVNMNSINAIDGLSSKTQNNNGGSKAQARLGKYLEDCHRNANGKVPVPSPSRVPAKDPVKPAAKPSRSRSAASRDEYLMEDVADESEESGSQTAKLKASFLAALGAHSKATDSLRVVVGQLIAVGVDPDTMVSWGEEAGYSESYVRSTVSALLQAQGVSRRAKGAGRKVSKDAESLLAYARKAFGNEAGKMLLAAYRLSVKEDKAAKANR